MKTAIRGALGSLTLLMALVSQRAFTQQVGVPYQAFGDAIAADGAADGNVIKAAPGRADSLTPMRLPDPSIAAPSPKPAEAPQQSPTGLLAAPGVAPAPHPAGPASAVDRNHWIDPAAPENSPCAADGGGYCCPPDWSFEEGARMLTRSRLRRLPLSQEYSYQIGTDPTDPDRQVNSKVFAPPLTTKRLSFDVATGYYATVDHYLGRDTSNRDQFLQFGFWGLNMWDISVALNGVMEPIYATSGPFDPADPPDVTGYTGSLTSFFESVDENLMTPSGRPATIEEKFISDGFNNVTQHRLAYTSSINSFELNARLVPRGRPDRLVLYPNGRWRRERDPGLSMSYLGGLRVLMIDEDFVFSGRGTTVRYNVVGQQVVETAIDTSGLYRIETRNDLFGFQIGGELKFRDRLWEWGARYKLGPFVNFAEHSSDLIGRRKVLYGLPDPEWYPRSVTVHRNARRTEVAGWAEVGVEGTYFITPNWIFHAAYDWMFLTNLALAPEQVDYRVGAAPTINTNGHALYHGLTLGLEWTW